MPRVSPANTADETSTTSTPPPPPPSRLRRIWLDWVKPILVVVLVVTLVRSSLLDWNDVPSGSMRPTIMEGDRIVVNKLAYGLNLPFNGPRIDVPLIGWSIENNPLDALPGLLYSRPERGDIVTFWNPVSGIRMVKRVVALPGEQVRVVDGRLQIRDVDGTPIPVTYENTDHRPYASEPTAARLAETRRGRRAIHGVDFAIEDLGGVRHFVQFLQQDGRWVPAGYENRFSPAGTQASGAWITLQNGSNADAQYFVVGDNRDNSADSRTYQRDGVFVSGEDITGKAKFIAVSFNGGWFRPAFSRWFSAFDAVD